MADSTTGHIGNVVRRKTPSPHRPLLPDERLVTDSKGPQAEPDSDESGRRENLRRAFVSRRPVSLVQIGGPLWMVDATSEVRLSAELLKPSRDLASWHRLRGFETRAGFDSLWNLQVRGIARRQTA